MKFGWQRSRIKGRRPPCVPSAGDTANPDELKDDLEKYEHLEELAERFFAAKRRQPPGTTAPAALNTHSFGLPVIATDVGSLRNDIMEAKTGFLCRAKNPADLTRTIRAYFASDLYRNLEAPRSRIREVANERNWWTRLGEMLDGVYRRVLAK